MVRSLTSSNGIVVEAWVAIHIDGKTQQDSHNTARLVLVVVEGWGTYRWYDSTRLNKDQQRAREGAEGTY